MKDTLVYHHTADASPGKQYDKTYAYHDAGAPRENGELKWPKGHGIQYPVFIEQDGEIIWGDIDALFWHAGDWNVRAIGICFAGDKRFQPLTDAQIDALVEVTDTLLQKKPITLIMNHYEIRPTSCPILDIRSIYKREKRRREVRLTPMNIRSHMRMLARLAKDSVGEVRDMRLRALERAKYRYSESASTNLDCCAT